MALVFSAPIVKTGLIFKLRVFSKRDIGRILYGAGSRPAPLWFLDFVGAHSDAVAVAHFSNAVEGVEGELCAEIVVIVGHGHADGDPSSFITRWTAPIPAGAVGSGRFAITMALRWKNKFLHCPPVATIFWSRKTSKPMKRPVNAPAAFEPRDSA